MKRRARRVLVTWQPFLEQQEQRELTSDVTGRQISMQISAKLWCLILSLYLLVIFTGCGAPPPEEPMEFQGPAGALGGEITLESEPVELGKVIAVGAVDKRQATGIIRPGGHYSFKRVPAGKVHLYLAFDIPPAARDQFLRLRANMKKLSSGMNGKKPSDTDRSAGLFASLPPQQQKWLQVVVRIPPSYEDVETAKLTTTIEESVTNKYDIKLEYRDQ
jgi:hypothetical protein